MSYNPTPARVLALVLVLKPDMKKRNKFFTDFTFSPQIILKILFNFNFNC